MGPGTVRGAETAEAGTAGEQVHGAVDTRGDAVNCEDPSEEWSDDGAERDTLLKCGCGAAVHVDSTPVVRIDGSAEYLCWECHQLLVGAREKLARAKRMTYFLITSGEDGIRIEAMEKLAAVERWIKDNTEGTDRQVRFLSKLPRQDDGHFLCGADVDYDKEIAVVLIDGEILKPKPRDVVKTWYFGK